MLTVLVDTTSAIA